MVTINRSCNLLVLFSPMQGQKGADGAVITGDYVDSEYSIPFTTVCKPGNDVEISKGRRAGEIEGAATAFA